MMTALPSSDRKVHKKRLHLYILLSYFIGLGANLPVFFAYTIRPYNDGYDANVPWLKVCYSNILFRPKADMTNINHTIQHTRNVI